MPRSSTWGLCLLLLVACGSRPGRPEQSLVSLGSSGFPRIEGLEYRWDPDTVWRPTETLRSQPEGRGDSNVLYVRFTLPESEAIDPAIYVSACVYLRTATIGTRRVDTQSCIIPVLRSEAGQSVELRFESSQRMREGQVVLVSQNALRRYIARTESGALWVSFALLVAAVFLGLLAARGGTEWLALASSAAFCFGMGLHFLQQTTSAENLLPIPLPLLRGLRDSASFIYPPAFMVFVGLTVGPVRAKPLYFIAKLVVATALIAFALQVLGLVSLRTMSSLTPVWTLICQVTALIALWRVRVEPAPRRLFYAIAASTLLAVPDTVWGSTGYQLIAQNTGHWSILPLVAGMVFVLQDRFRASATAMQQRLAHIEQLNEELRHQVEARSRELRGALASMPPPTPRDAVSGEVIDGRYRVEELLGRGGMAQVYRVTRLLDGQSYALKLLSGKVTRIDAARFAREAELAARLRHPNLVPVVDVGLVANGPLFLVMELVQGLSLAQLHARFGEEAWARKVLTDIARGLTKVHEAGVVHRDLKPSNVMVAGDVARLTDFGVARPDAELALDVDDTVSRGSGPAEGNLTQTGAIIGTPRYMAPEVVRGEGATRASDVFSLGLIAFEVLTGKYPMVDPPYVAILAKRPLERAVPDESVPEGVRELLKRMVHEVPAERPTAAEVLAALENRAPSPPAGRGLG